jgi:hypothetical protein
MDCFTGAANRTKEKERGPALASFQRFLAVRKDASPGRWQALKMPENDPPARSVKLFTRSINESRTPFSKITAI